MLLFFHLHLEDDESIPAVKSGQASKRKQKQRTKKAKKQKKGRAELNDVTEQVRKSITEPNVAIDIQDIFYIYTNLKCHVFPVYNAKWKLYKS